jgi:4-hydroxy-tetrahydrodipicolinate synthase
MFHGSIVALVTPMDERGQIDFAALRKLLAFHLENGTDAIVVAGTTGESAALDEDEFSRLLEATLNEVEGRVPVLAGTGSANTETAIQRTRLAGEIGADGALVVTPYYVRPMQSGLQAHFLAIASATQIPLVLYNVPSRTSVDLLPETVMALANCDEIVAIKEAVPSPGRIRALVDCCGDRISVLSGDDPSCLNAMREGAVGVVSVAANVIPDRISSLCGQAARSDWTAARQSNEELHGFFAITGLETNPIPVKWALYKMGLIGPGIRLPLLPLAEEHHETVLKGLLKLGLDIK